MTTASPVAIKGIRLPREAVLKEEQADEYGPGGYRQVQVGEYINANRYRVVRKLGFGHFSTVWLAKDEQRNNHVALKVVKSAYKYAQTAIDEIALLRIIQHHDRGGLDHPGRKHIVQFLDCFALHPTKDVVFPLDRNDPSAKNVCMTFEPLGENLLTLLKRLSTCDETNLKIGVPTVLVQQIVRQILWGLDYLHTHCQLIHTDLKLENVIVAVEDVEELVCACRASEHMTGVSPTNATRLVPMKETASPQNSLRNVVVPGGGDWRNQREITITGSSPLPSPMHAWGRVNVGPEVNSLALIMAQMALQRKVGEGPDGLDMPTIPDYAEAMGESPSSESRSNNEQRPSGTSDSGASSLASVNSSTTLFSMTSASTAPTSMESSLIISASSPVVKQHAGSPPSSFMPTPFSFDDHDLLEETRPETAGLSKKRLSSQSNLTLKRSGQPSSPSKDVTLTPIPTPTPYSQNHYPINTSLLTAKKPTNATTSNHNISLPHNTLQQSTSGPLPPLTTTTNAHMGGGRSRDGDRGRQMTDEPRRKSMPTLPKPPPRIRVKIADMGNATPMSKHFTPDIQTRPYRAPEVLLGYRNWTETVDIWSVGTMLFELLTSDLLFLAEEDKKFGRYTRDDDHLAQIVELLGDFPWNRKWGGRYSQDFFNDRGGLRRVAKLRPWGLKAVLTQKYDYPQEQAVKLREFMLPMLALDPNDRPSAADLAKHPWLDDLDAAPPYAADRVSTTDDFYQVDDARLTEVLQALQAVSIHPESNLAAGIPAPA